MGCFNSVPNKAGGETSGGGAIPFDEEGIRQDIITLMNKPEWDDGSYGPLLLRLAWHSSGTYDKNTKTGGSNGATMRFGREASDKENVGLDHARDILEPIKQKYDISYSDLWILAAYVFLAESDGPKLEFVSGRVDKEEAPKPEEEVHGRLPEASHGVEEKMEIDEHGRVVGWETTAQHVKDTFDRMGFSIRETVALLCGGHVYGRCHNNLTGFQGPWVEEPTKFSNEYAADMIEDEWVLVKQESQVSGCPVHHSVRPAKNQAQYVRVIPEDEREEAENGDGQQMMLVSDMVLLWDPEFKEFLEIYADEETGTDELRKDFGKAFKKLTELGCENILESQ